MMNAYFVIMDKAGEQPLFEAEFFRPDFLTKVYYIEEFHALYLVNLLERSIARE